MNELNYKFKVGIDKKEYEKFVSRHFMANLLQSSNWPNIKKDWDSEYTAIYDSADEIVACGLILIKNVKGIKFGYMPRGPILDYQNKSLLKFYIEQLKKYAKTRGLIFIKMDPKVILKKANIKEFHNTKQDVVAQDIICILKECKVKYKGETIMMSETFQPRFEGTTYLSENTIESFSKDAKQSIRKARKKGVESVWGAYEDIEIFSELIEKTMERKKVNLRNRQYFEQLWQNYESRVMLGLTKLDVVKTRENIQQSISEVEIKKEKTKKSGLKVELEAQKSRLQKDLDILSDIKEDVIFMSGIFAIGYGDTLEILYAGMDEAYKSFYPQYMLYIDIMEKAFEMGYKKACIGGIEGTLDDGLTISKVNYGATIVSYIGEFDIVASPIYYIFNLAWKIRKNLKKKK